MRGVRCLASPIFGLFRRGKWSTFSRLETSSLTFNNGEEGGFQNTTVNPRQLQVALGTSACEQSERVMKRWPIRLGYVATVKKATVGLFLSCAIGLTAWSAPAGATVELRGFSNEELSSLSGGGAVERRFELPHRGTKYLAAVSYGVLNRPCSESRGLLHHPTKHLARALPATRRVERQPDDAQTRMMRLRIEHGNSLVQGSWGALYRITDDQMAAQFWLDPNAPRDVNDVFGYLRLTPWSSQQCLVTAAVAVDTGDGLLASLFRSMIHSYLVKTAARIQRYVTSPEFMS
jgi:hypothetical protein